MRLKLQENFNGEKLGLVCYKPLAPPRMFDCLTE